MGGFKVVIEELETAANHIFAAADTADSVSPGSFEAKDSAVGHEGLTAAITVFGETWDFARKELQSRATGFGQQLEAAGWEYERLDRYEAQRLRRSGGW